MIFWERVKKCKHNNISPNYLEDAGCCMSDMGSHSAEYHCLDCGVYISECGCGCSTGLSGWPKKRWDNLVRR